MAKSNRKSANRVYKVERLELRALLAGDVVWNNSNWDASAGYEVPVKQADTYYLADGKPQGLNVSESKLVIGLADPAANLPDFLSLDYGMGGRANVYQTSQPLTPALLATIEAIPGVSYTAPVYVGAGSVAEAALLDEFIVDLKDGAKAEEFFGSLPEVASYRPIAGSSDQFVGQFTGIFGRKALERANSLAENDLVDWTAPNFYQNWQKFYIPNDPRIGFQWHLRNIGQSGGVNDADSDVTEAWDINRGGSQNIIVAVIDDGVQSTHPDLNVWTNPGEIAGDNIDNDGNGWIDDIHGWNFVFDTNQSEPQGTDAHGTAVGGVAAARGDNGLGVAGAAYNSQLISIKMFDGNSVASDANIASALRYSAGINRTGNGTWKAGDVVNNSWGGGLESAAINAALVAGTTTGRGGIGATYLFATGNGFAASVSQPAAQASNIPGVIAVGATNNRGTRSDYSNYGSAVDFVTPSDDSRNGYLAIDTTDRTGADGYSAGDYTGNGTGASGGAGFGGTSSATPLASGIAALALAQAESLGINLSPTDFRSMMRNNTDLIGGATYSITTGKNIEYGYGRLNAQSLLNGIGNAEISVVNTTQELNSGATVALGTALSGQYVETVVRIRNQGTEDLVIDSIIAPAGFSVPSFRPSTLGIGQVLLLTIRFNPTAPGTYNGNLFINSNDANESAFRLRLTGSSTAPSIGGTAFEDFDGNGIFEADERGLAGGGGYAYLDLNDNGSFDAGETQSPLTAEGFYSFSPLANGTYTVRMDLPGWTRTSLADSFTVTLANSTDYSIGNDFGYGKNDRFYPFVIEDLDGDGTLNGQDLPLPDFLISAGTGTFSYSNDVPVDIPDSDGFNSGVATSAITIDSSGPIILDLDVTINLIHTFDSDLTINLIAPDGTVITLADSVGLDEDNFIGTIFDDDAAIPIDVGTAPFTGRFQPMQLLSTFDGISAAGVWQLEVIDNFEFDTGTILSWSMEINGLRASVSDVNGWAPLDLPTGQSTAVLQLPPNWEYTVPIDGTHTIDAAGAPIFGYTYGARLNPLPPTDIRLTTPRIEENLPALTPIGQFTSIDPNRGDTFTYQLISGTGDIDNARFVIIDDILYSNEIFDYESNQAFSIRVESRDSTGLTYEEVMLVTVLNVNETPLVVFLAPNNVFENSTNGTLVGNLFTVDTDILTDFLFTYTLVPGTGDDDNALFAIAQDTLVVNGPIDFETDNVLTVRVRSTDEGGLFVEEILTILVDNVNESPTTITLSGNSLPENEPAGFEIGTFSNDDPDLGDTLTYSLVAGPGGEDNIMFQTVGDKLYSAVTFNFEARSSYNIRVRVVDRGGLALEQPFVINVTDVNEPPASVIISNSRIRENLPTNTFIGTVSSTDSDAGDSTVITIVSGPGGEDNASFYLAGNALYSNASFDYESKRLLSVLFEARDASGLTSRQSIQIAVLNVNEAPSEISLSPNTVPENAPLGTLIGDLSTIDIDQDNVFRYEFANGIGDADNAQFSIVGSQLYTNGSYDFDVKKSYTTRLRSTDLGGLSVERNVLINITNVNDPPTALALSNNTVAENSPVGSLVGAFSTTDADDGDTFSYYFARGAGDNDNTLFNIVGNELRTSNVFNYESRQNYSVRIVTRDAGGLAFEQVFPLQITNVNETPLTVRLSRRSIAENSPLDTVLGVLSTTDTDTLTDTQFNYSLVAGEGDANNNLFKISANQILLNGNLDFEQLNKLSIRVRSTDLGGLFIEGIFRIDVTNVNEIPTVLSLSNNSLLENSPAGTVIGLFSNNDPDFADSHIYTLEPGAGSTDNLQFDIVGNELRSFQSFDFETKSVYNIRVRVTDRVGGFIESPFVIQVLDGNELPSSLILTGNTIAENLPSNTFIGALQGTDPDSGAVLSYSLVTGVGSEDNSSFILMGTDLYSSGSFDFETKSLYSIRTRVEDQFGAGIERVFTIRVTDVNENPTSVSVSPSTVAERLPINSLVGTLNTADPDAGDSFTYSLVAGAGDANNGSFQISGNRLRTKEVFDFDVKSSYSVRVRSVDAGGFSTESVLNISVLNVNDQPTDILLSNNTVAENQPIGVPTLVGNFSTIDADDTDSYTYTFVPGTGDTDNAKWQISGNGLFTNAALDFETQPIHRLRVRSTDAGGLSTEKAFVIQITNVNESPVAIILSRTTISENIPIGTVVGTLTTLDPDALDSFTYTLVPGTGSVDNAAFSLSGNQLQTATSIDFEAKSSYGIRIRTTDAAGLSFENAFTITVVNVNEAPTSIRLSQSAFENQAVSVPIGQLSASDPDAGDTVSFAKVVGQGDSDNSLVQVMSDGRIFAISPLNYELKPTLAIRVRGTDAAGLSLEQNFIINVIDQNDVPTDIRLQPSSIIENNAPGMIVGSLSTTDEDPSDLHSYTLVSGTGDSGNSKFSIDGSDVVANDSLDFELQPSYSIRVRSNDGAGGAIEKVLTVQIINQNEVATDILLSNMTINENLPANTQVGSLSTLDPDTPDTFVYSLIPSGSNSDHTAFAIVGNSLRTTRSLDFESQAVYNLIIRSVDAGGLEITKPFAINVSNVEEAPVDLTLIGSSFDENIPSGSLVGLLTATDPDLAGPVAFSLVSGALDNSRFAISGNQLLTNGQFDFETRSLFNIRVRATDVAGQFLDRNFEIRVLDVNEVPTILALSNASIAENSSALEIGLLSTNDPDTNEVTSYALVSGNGSADNSAFLIQGNRLIAKSAFDFETKASYAIRVQSTDSVGHQLVSNFVVQVLDRNDSPTGVSLSPSSVPENAGSNRVIGLLSAIDQDFADTFTYSLIGTRPEFSILGNQLIATQSFDFETLSNYLPTIRVVDAAGASIDVPVAVSVTNVNERPTNILLSNQSVNENLAPGALVGLLNATDVDAGDSATYTLVNGSGGFDNSQFKIVGNRLESNARFDFEKRDSYSVRVRATDAGGLTFEKPFIIMVNNMVEFPPFATNDAFVTSYGRPITMDVLANDSGQGAPIDPTTVRIVTTPTAGVASVMPDGRILYTNDVASPIQIVFQYDYRDANQMLSNVATVTVSFYSAFQNQENRLDVNADGSVSPLDVLEVINYINSHPGQAQLPPNSPDNPPFIDVDGDGFATPLDALIVVNSINQGPAAAEGEGTSADSDAIDLAFSIADENASDWYLNDSELESDPSKRAANRLRGSRR